MALPGSGTLSYNNTPFDSLIKTKVTGKPVYDEAKRMVKYLEWSIHVRAYITVDAATLTTDATLDTLRRRLTTPGKDLTYTTKGFGTFAINPIGGGSVQDVLWGPIPEVLDFTPVGNSKTALVEWRCVAHIPECDNATYEFALMMVNYEVDYSIDSDGYTTIRTSGALEIPQTHSGSRIPRDTADNYRERIRPPVLPGFKREQSFKLSKNKNRLDFSFNDKEIPIALPHGASHADVKHTVRDYKLKGSIPNFVMWTATIAGTIRMQAGRSKAEAWEKFLLILTDRIYQNPAGGVISFQVLGGRVQLLDVMYEDDVFGTDARFSVSYLLRSISLNRILVESGLWRPIPGTGFAAWQGSMETSAHHVRGNAKLRHRAQDDVLVDLCQNVAPRVDPGPSSQPPGQGGYSLLLAPKGVVPNQNIEPESSWLHYECELRYHEDDHVARHKPLNGQVQFFNPIASATGEPTGVGRIAVSAAPSVSATVPDLVQQVAEPSATIVLEGSALRLGHQIEPPRLISAFGVQCRQAEQDIAHRTVCNFGGVPLILCTWRIAYILPSIPRAIPIIANPFLQLPGSG